MEYPHILPAEEWEVPDFSKGPYGLVVTRSDHWYRERGHKIPKRNKELGIVTDRNFFQDGHGRIICWPVIRWEGGVMDSMTHPMNATPLRKKHALPLVKMDDGQWGTHGPPKQDATPEAVS